MSKRRHARVFFSGMTKPEYWGGPTKGCPPESEEAHHFYAEIDRTIYNFKSREEVLARIYKMLIHAYDTGVQDQKNKTRKNLEKLL